jgi:hypothetical protein
MAATRRRRTKGATTPMVLDAGGRRRFAEVARQICRAPLASRDKIAVARDLRAHWHNYTLAVQRAIGAQWARIAQRAKGDA